MFKIQSDSITWGGCITGLPEWHRSFVFLQRMATQGEVPKKTGNLHPRSWVLGISNKIGFPCDRWRLILFWSLIYLMIINNEAPK